jgi:hypothetical protein
VAVLQEARAFVVLQEVDPALRRTMGSWPEPTDATPNVLTRREAWFWLKLRLDLLRRSEKWNFKPRVEYELDASGGLFWTRMTATSRLEQFKALAYDAFRDARFKFRRCPECKRPFVPVRRQAYCSAVLEIGDLAELARLRQSVVRTRKWRRAHLEKNREIRRQQYKRSVAAKLRLSKRAEVKLAKRAQDRRSK